ncbi:MAG: hypothetical protein C4533_08300 [Candidatus Omnitrophota bacterium]|jgi:hypothetical protein|nr:MAG: hypothetical protein C4533_08300 [Candidatus Omnitrophota bacterium]
MEFNEIRKELEGVDFDTLRTDCDNYFEAVILKEELEKLRTRLEKTFGSPAWPSKEKLSMQVRQTIDSFGGIMSGQTLYYNTDGKDAIFAMLWPWQDGQHTTVKIIQKV